MINFLLGESRGKGGGKGKRERGGEGEKGKVGSNAEENRKREQKFRRSLKAICFCFRLPNRFRSEDHASRNPKIKLRVLSI